MANEHNFVFCATKWIGMSDEDIPNAIGILQNLSNFPTLTDRLQQAMLDQLFLARLMIHPHGFVSDPAFQDAIGQPGDRHQRGVLRRQQPGRHLRRHGDGHRPGHHARRARRAGDELLAAADPQHRLRLYSLVLYPAYTNELQRPLGLALIQMLWDRSDPNGYAQHITSDPLPGTPAHKVLLHLAFGDHQVANVGTEIEARTIGASIHHAGDRAGRHSDVDPYFGIPAIPTYPFDGSALIVWDSGAATPPITNTAPSIGSRSARRAAQLRHRPAAEVRLPAEGRRRGRRRLRRHALRAVSDPNGG